MSDVEIEDEENVVAGKTSDSTIVLAVLMVILIIAGILYLFYRVPN
jgi:flagellar basal body-associated protein FliL